MKYSFYRNVIMSDATELLCSSTANFLRFSCTDPGVFDVEHELFASSNVIKTLLEDINAFDQGKSGHMLNQVPIALPFSAYNFQRCLDFMIHGPVVEPAMSGEDLVHSIKIADFFDMTPLKEAAIAELGEILENPCLKTIRRRLCIKNDFRKFVQHQMVLEGLDEPEETGNNSNRRSC